ncbi:MAG TPA: response regulator [Opitutaceae bacterium]|nr:response regulator [Opitutaceae bacterium]
MKKKILIIDDDPQICKSLRKVLQAEGYEVVLAASGREGLDKFDPVHTDLVMLDINLPGEKGWDVFARITSINALLPIIIITGRQDQFEMAAAAGVGALIEKPMDMLFLLQTVAEMLVEPLDARIERLAGLNHYMRFSYPKSNGASQKTTPS